MSLQNIHCISIDTHLTLSNGIAPNNIAWLGFAIYPKNTRLASTALSSSHQKIGVRLLLAYMLDLLDIKDRLDDSSFPYRLQRHGYHISFSHSVDSVSCAISVNSPIAIDQELKPVPFSVAKRFFHANELRWMSDSDEKEFIKNNQQAIVNILWMLKESYIKFYGNLSLIEGLSLSFVDIIKLMVGQNNSLFQSNSSKDILMVKVNGNLTPVCLPLPASSIQPKVIIYSLRHKFVAILAK